MGLSAFTGSRDGDAARVATREQVLRLLDEGHDYPAVGLALGIPAGQAYLLATGVPADGKGVDDIPGDRPYARTSAQALVNPPHENPTSKKIVHDWLAGRVAADAQQRAAGAARREKESS